MEKELKRLRKQIKDAAIQLSQLSYKYNQMNEVLRTAIIKLSVLEKRTGGIINDEELKEEYKSIKSKYDESKKGSH